MRRPESRARVESPLVALLAILLLATPAFSQTLNSPPQAVADSYSMKEDTTLTVVVASGVLANDTDADGNALTVAGPAAVTAPLNGSLLLNADGSFSYTPRPNFSGTDSFTYNAHDGTLISLTPATVTITVSDVQEPPVAVDDSYSASEGKTLTVAAPGVLANDTDAETNALAVAGAVAVSGPSNGSVTINPDGSFAYTPATAFVGTDSFTYKAHDGTAESDKPATVTITVAAVNDAPVAVDDTYTVGEDSTLTVDAATGVLRNDTDADAGALTVAEPRPISGPSHGTLTLNADGSFTYTPEANYYGTDTFAYKVSDGTSQSANTANVTIIISDVADTPTELLSLHQNVPLVATLDNPCTGVAEAIAFTGAVELRQTVWKMPDGRLRLYLYERTAMHGKDTLAPDGPKYGFAGESEMDVEFAPGSATLMIHKKVANSRGDDDFHAMLLVAFDPASLRLDLRVEGVCGDGE